MCVENIINSIGCTVHRQHIANIFFELGDIACILQSHIDFIFIEFSTNIALCARHLNDTVLYDSQMASGADRMECDIDWTNNKWLSLAKIYTFRSKILAGNA